VLGQGPNSAPKPLPQCTANVSVWVVCHEYSDNSSSTGKTLTVIDGSHSAKLAPHGNHMAGSFVTAGLCSFHPKHYRQPRSSVLMASNFVET
jgi:hypothetical protein